MGCRSMLLFSLSRSLAKANPQSERRTPVFEMEMSARVCMFGGTKENVALVSPSLHASLSTLSLSHSLTLAASTLAGTQRARAHSPLLLPVGTTL